MNIVEGHVLGGSEGLEKPLHKYVIGAMREEAMARYIDAGSLLIVGNREDAHSLALEQGAGVLITGDSVRAERLSDSQTRSVCRLFPHAMILLQWHL